MAVEGEQLAAWLAPYVASTQRALHGQGSLPGGFKVRWPWCFQGHPPSAWLELFSSPCVTLLACHLWSIKEFRLKVQVQSYSDITLLQPGSRGPAVGPEPAGRAWV